MTFFWQNPMGPVTRAEAEKAFAEALPQIESASIRKWASDQREVWIGIIQKMRPEKVREGFVAGYITGEAIGLWG